MNRKRRVLITSALAVLVLGVAVVPSIAAPEKQFTIIAPATASPSATFIDVAVKNTTPNGNSNISSLTLTGAGPTGFAITGVSPGTGSADGQTIAITGISPIKPGNSRTFRLTVDMPNLGCGNGTITWSGTAFTGNSLGGDAFTFKSEDPAAQLTTTVTANCGLRINPAVSDGIVNQNVSVTVEAVSGNSVVTSFTGNITLTVTAKPTGSTVTPSAPQEQAAVAGATTFTLKGNTVGSYTVQASATDLGSATASDTFTLFAEGISCYPDSDTETGGGTSTTLYRTDDGPGGPDDCRQVPYTLTAQSSVVVLLKDQTVVDQQGAEFKLVITWGLAPGDYGDFNTSEFDPDGIEGNGDEYVPANCAIVGGNAVPPPPTATEHWCFAGLSIVPTADGYEATETFLGSGDPNIRYK